MIQNKNQNIIYLDTNNLYGYAMSKFLLTGKLQWIDPKDFDLNSFKYMKLISSIQENYMNYIMIIL